MRKSETGPISLEQLYAEHFDALYRLACHQLSRYTGSSADASDMVQDVFLLAARRWTELRMHSNPVGWLMKATRLMCMNHVRARYRQQEKERDWKHHELRNQSKTYGPLYSDAAEDETCVQDLLISLEQALNPDDYQILKAYCIDKRSMEEISREKGLSAVALRVRIHRLRQEIAKILLLLVTLLARQNI